MGVDIIILVKVNNKEFRLGSGNMNYENYYPFVVQNIVNTLKNNITNPVSVASKSNDWLTVLDSSFDKYDPDIIIDYDNKTVEFIKIHLCTEKEFAKEWDVEFVNKKGKTYVHWDNDDDDDLVFDSSEQIEKIRPLLNKDELTFDELATYVEFLTWCEKQIYMFFRSNDGLIFYNMPV